MATCTIACDTADAIIRYTTNGADPTESDTVYSTPFSVDAGVTVKAKAWKDGMLESAVASGEAPEELQPTSVPLGSTLSDGSVVIYDRGSSYGDYNLTDGVLMRLSEGADDESASSNNWRFIIADSADMAGNNGGIGENKAFCPSGSLSQPVHTGMGSGLMNTSWFIEQYGTDESYIWYQVQQKRTATNLNWFVPGYNDCYSVMKTYLQGLSESQVYFESMLSGDNSGPFGWNFASNEDVSVERNSTDCRVRLVRRY